MILQLLNVFLLGLILWLCRPQKSMRIIYFLGALFRICCGFFIGWVYLIHQQAGDTLTFHLSATELFQLVGNSLGDYVNYLFTSHHGPAYGEARTEFMVKILSLLYIMVDGNYWLASVYFSLGSFFAAWHLIEKLCAQKASWFVPAAIAFLFLPSATLWSSGILKDTVTTTCIFYLSAVCIDYENKSSLKFHQVFLTTIALLILFHLKFYLLAVTAIIMALLAWDMTLDNLTRHFYTKVSLHVIGLMVIGFAVTQLNFNLHIENLPDVIFNNYQTMLLKSEAGEALRFPGFTPSYWSVISTIPESLASGLFRPFAWEVKPSLLPFAIENLFIFSLFIFNLRYYKEFQMNRLVLLSLLFIIVLAAVLPMTAPNFGTLTRYKASFLPFFIFLIMVIPYQRLFLKK